MNLPKITTPTYELTMPSTGQTHEYRPYLTKEEKILLMAKESGDESKMISALTTIIENCVSGVNDAGALTNFDFEYIFLKLRSVSSGESLTPKFKCNGTVTDDDGNESECGNQITIPVDISAIEPTEGEGHVKDIKLDDSGIGVIMRYPTVKMVKEMTQKKLNQVETMYETITQCIETIYDADNTYPAKEASRKDMVTFVESLTSDMREKIQKKFFDTMPSVVYKTTVTCPVCGKEHDVTLKGIQDFF